MGIQYDDFLDESYAPGDADLLCTFRLAPGEGMSLEAAAARVASESSNGTWAALDVESDISRLSAMAYDLERETNTVRVAYPPELFEPGSLPQILSCIAGNIMGMKAVDTIRLVDCEWPESVVSGFPGPGFGPAVKSEFLDATDRPALATVPKPKVGLPTSEHVRVAREAWLGGVDLLKDDENLTDQAFNPFRERVVDSFAARDEVQDETGERKDYLVNVTAETTEMLERVDFVHEQGGSFVMVDIITCGWSALQTVRERCEELGLAIHAHRAMHAAFDRLPHHGVSMRVLAQWARLAGVDHLHTGTAGFGKLENEDTAGINEWLRSDLYGMKEVLPTASGGLHPGVVPQVLDALGPELIVQAGGGIHGHPDGTRAGAMALRQSVEAWQEGVSLEEYAKSHPELRVAVEKWGSESPR
ncbi:type III ribulose-bisphosphate carboxylase [Natronomonas sp. EA1]|uniref:type III ribulose-bisphosphate carboxylase n=1 Tax=Natronomonas sp. EA1 TaxID=3421655 RepID=UPI003EB6EC2B